MSLSQMVVEHFYLQPTGGRQNFRIIFPDRVKAAALSLPEGEPLLEVQRFINFEPSKNAIYS